MTNQEQPAPATQPEAAVPSPSVEEARAYLLTMESGGQSNPRIIDEINQRVRAKYVDPFEAAVRREEQQRWGGVDWQKARGDAIERTLASALARAATANVALRAVTIGGIDSRRPLTSEGYENIINGLREVARAALDCSTQGGQ